MAFTFERRDDSDPKKRKSERILTQSRGLKGDELNIVFPDYRDRYRSTSSRLLNVKVSSGDV